MKVNIERDPVGHWIAQCLGEWSILSSGYRSTRFPLRILEVPSLTVGLQDFGFDVGCRRRLRCVSRIVHDVGGEGSVQLKITSLH